jgi:hypothetical protein
LRTIRHPTDSRSTEFVEGDSPIAEATKDNRVGEKITIAARMDAGLQIDIYDRLKKDSNGAALVLFLAAGSVLCRMQSPKIGRVKSELRCMI